MEIDRDPVPQGISSIAIYLLAPAGKESRGFAGAMLASGSEASAKRDRKISGASRRRSMAPQKEELLEIEKLQE